MIEDQWLAAQVRVGSEDHVSRALTHKGYDLFAPTYERCRRWSDRIKTHRAPLFPGYIFCRMNGTAQGRLIATPGFIRLVGFGRGPVPIPDQEIEALQRAITSGQPLSPVAYLAAGRRVKIIGGALAGVEGHFLASRPKHRLVVSVHLLQRSVAIELDHCAIEPL